jgi:hypothetical protein
MLICSLTEKISEILCTVRSGLCHCECPTSIYCTAKVMKLLLEGKNPGEGYFPEQGLLPHYLALRVYQLMEARACRGGSYTGSVQQ